MMHKRILVTGGAGFIGAHLCRRLVEAGHEVLCVDDFSTGSRENVEPLLENAGFEIRRQDVTTPFDVESDEIYNLACPASPLSYQRDPVQTTKTSIYGAIHMLELAQRRQARIFQASTSEVYGNPGLSPQPESYWGNVNPIGVRACYNEAKRCAETLFFDHWRQNRLRIKIARIFNTYGPNMQPDDGRVVSNFVVQALRNEPITIYGNGSQTRSFCYVSDMVEGFIRLMATSDEVTGPVNLGSADEISIRDLAELIVSLVGSRSEIVYCDLPGDDPKQRRPDLALAKRLLDWRPAVQLTDGLGQTIAYFDRRLASGHM